MSDINKFPGVKIKFKGAHCEFFSNPMNFPIRSNDLMIVEADRGEDIGIACANHLDKETLTENEDTLRILRKATEQDLMRHGENRLREKIAFQFCSKKVLELNLPMKLVDVEYRLDRKKITFYFTADDRIDFRDLVKILAAEYKTRIEMRQISTREELKRTGGVGICGKPLCCNNWLDNLEPISTQLVKEQNLPLNPTKISGSCGKLKCCLLYEHDIYSKFLEQFPQYGTKVSYKKKTGVIDKIDIFQKVVTIKFEDDHLEEIPLQEFESKIKVLD